MAILQVVLGDITLEETDAIVNAANHSLLGGGGVDGAIHRAAGLALLAECRALGGCETGDARITGGGRLKAAWVVHAVGPVWHGGGNDEDALLAACYRRALALAAEKSARSIAFPAISTGAYGFPAERAASIAVGTVAAALPRHASIERVVFACFGARSAAAHRAALARLGEAPAGR